MARPLEDLLWHRIHPSREVQVVDPADKVLPPGQDGFVRIRIDDGLDGYLDDPPATRELFRDGYARRQLVPGLRPGFRSAGR